MPTFMRTAQFVAPIFAAALVTAYKSGDGMSKAADCRANCVDKGGVFCKNFGVDNFGYCCDSANTSPCSMQTMQCTIF